MPKVMVVEILVSDVLQAEEATVDRVQGVPIPKVEEVVLGDEMTLEVEEVVVAVEVLEVIQDLEGAEDHAGSQVAVAVRVGNLRVEEATQLKALQVAVKPDVPS